MAEAVASTSECNEDANKILATNPEESTTEKRKFSESSDPVSNYFKPSDELYREWVKQYEPVRKRGKKLFKKILSEVIRCRDLLKKEYNANKRDYFEIAYEILDNVVNHLNDLHKVNLHVDAYWSDMGATSLSVLWNHNQYLSDLTKCRKKKYYNTRNEFYRRVSFGYKAAALVLNTIFEDHESYIEDNELHPQYVSEVLERQKLFRNKFM